MNKGLGYEMKDLKEIKKVVKDWKGKKAEKKIFKAIENTELAHFLEKEYTIKDKIKKLKYYTLKEFISLTNLDLNISLPQVGKACKFLSEVQGFQVDKKLENRRNVNLYRVDVLICVVVVLERLKKESKI